jgi:hypothetical protein
MSLLKLLARGKFVVVSGLAAAALAGCTMTPAFDDGASGQSLALNFAAPTNEYEQIVYQDLTRRFGAASDPAAPEVSVHVSTASRTLAQSQTSDPAASYLMTATGVIRITKGGQNVLTATRQATATYTENSQVLSQDAAQTNAAEQASHALAETLELTIISALAPTAPSQ